MMKVIPEEGHPKDIIVLERNELVAGYTYSAQKVIPFQGEFAQELREITESMSKEEVVDMLIRHFTQGTANLAHLTGV